MGLSFWVYIMAGRRNGTLYIGSTDDLPRRAWEHREGVIPGFTKKYGVKLLVWFETHESRESALLRERQMKKWERRWKLQVIEAKNPQWRDLADEIGVL
jgi:putative endonuclease